MSTITDAERLAEHYKTGTRHVSVSDIRELKEEWEAADDAPENFVDYCEVEIRMRGEHTTLQNLVSQEWGREVDVGDVVPADSVPDIYGQMIPPETELIRLLDFQWDDPYGTIPSERTSEDVEVLWEVVR